jgi:predicted anti-sigma-YlaC factor YlaD
MLPVVCERFRAYVSLALDGELAELEQVMLDSHLERCSGCREFAMEAAGSTHALRTAELECPTHAISVPLIHRRTPLRAIQATAAAAVAVAAAAVALTLAPGPSRSSSEVTVRDDTALVIRALKVSVPKAGRVVSRTMRHAPGLSPERPDSR